MLISGKGFIVAAYINAVRSYIHDDSSEKDAILQQTQILLDAT